MIIIKPGASIRGCRAEILTALIADIAPVFASHGVETVVTSGCEVFKHTVKRSSHYRGDAIDCRSKHLTKAAKPKVLADLRQALGEDFVVILEAVGKPWEHFHIHWSPVYSGSTGDH